MLDHFKTFARYNAWANGRLYEAAGQLDDAAYFLDRRGFFGSIHRTLNHLVLTDRIWLGRIVGEPNPPVALSHVLYDDRRELRRAREAEDARLIQIVDGLGEEAMARELTYANMAGAPQRTPMAHVMAHLFNHETHHRGQVHDMLSQAGLKPPELDLIFYLRRV